MLDSLRRFIYIVPLSLFTFIPQDMLLFEPSASKKHVHSALVEEIVVYHCIEIGH
jgi:hypothetical protein